MAAGPRAHAAAWRLQGSPAPHATLTPSLRERRCHTPRPCSARACPRLGHCFPAPASPERALQTRPSFRRRESSRSLRASCNTKWNDVTTWLGDSWGGPGAAFSNPQTRSQLLTTPSLLGLRGWTPGVQGVTGGARQLILGVKHDHTPRPGPEPTGPCCAPPGTLQSLPVQVPL